MCRHLREDLVFGNGHLLDPGSEKKWYSAENSPQGAWDHIAEDMLLEFAESGHPTFRPATPLSRGQLKSKGRGKLSIHFTADQDTVDTIYRIILSVSQLSIYGAVAAICDEFENHQDGTGQPVILVGQSIVLAEVKAEVPVHDDRNQYGKHGIEIRIRSVGQDKFQSWVRISYGTNKYVVDSNQDNTEILADPH